MHSRKTRLNVSRWAALAGLLTLSACEPWDMTPKSDFAEQAMRNHYQSGDMNGYQYQENSQVFHLPPKTPTITDSEPEETEITPIKSTR